ncbi:unnamed protein product [Camellia sinensis]
MGKKAMEMESCVPPGFRFHPTEEELVGYYLYRKVNSLSIDLQVIMDIDLYRMEPWHIQDNCRLGYEEQTEWYFFSHKDKKYPTGTRTNRATAAGFWKATGRDKPVLSKNKIIGMRKTLVFYAGRAPNGRKTDWIMHEYRLQTVEHAPPQQEEGWVVCRAFKKPSPSHKQGFESWNHAYYVANKGMFGQPSYPNVASPIHMIHLNQSPFESSEQELMSMSDHRCLDNQLVQLPQIDSPPNSSLATKGDANEQNSIIINRDYDGEWSSRSSQYVDWKILDDMLAPQLAESTSIANSNREISLVSQEYDLNAQNYATHLFPCLPDL